MQIPTELESKAVNNWSVDDVSIWLSHNSIPQDCVNIIKGEEIDGMSITALDIPALKEIGLTRFGPRVNTFNLINALIDHGKRDQAVRENIAPMLTSVILL
ncbi:hypothetical protein CONCODRAFT_77922 [Conidiobolus coronatus NRRL 28638]|uniref:SAM domain-containing protein n=1 Tax=Conidiobolus coronatus (strain ATCC 28846 / CBS 209.66 / NRRL 28638) TaxID=796925 RepID=A0A137PB01_CONC2|nr:hypothetical protein CONCODRAFT_77922 [Conidiobolus coronatus NRRL 28638]|eukprot:KXN72183.1 hypothetical protein CONCODRAFT_77922 [Conidiobolus coronatus NRRL 28638]